MDKNSNKSFIDKVGDILNLERKVDKLVKEQEKAKMERDYTMVCVNDLVARVAELEAKLAKRSVV